MKDDIGRSSSGHFNKNNNNSSNTYEESHKERQARVCIVRYVCVHARVPYVPSAEERLLV